MGRSLLVKVCLHLTSVDINDYCSTIYPFKYIIRHQKSNIVHYLLYIKLVKITIIDSRSIHNLPSIPSMTKIILYTSYSLTLSHCFPTLTCKLTQESPNHSDLYILVFIKVYLGMQYDDKLVFLLIETM